MQKKSFFLVLAVLTLTSVLSAHADGLGISSQFGFQGWPNRQAVCQTAAPTEPPYCDPIFEWTPTWDDVFATAMPQDATCTSCSAAPATPVPTSVPETPASAAPSPTTAPLSTPTSVPVMTLAPTPKPAPTRTPSTGDDYTTVSISAQEQNAFNLLNSDRNANHLAPLTLDPALCRLARIKSEDMRDHHYFAHESPTYGNAASMLAHFGYPFSAVGENIAHHATIEKAEAAFMSSEGHRRNILAGSWTKVGVGVCYDANGYVYVTQLFVR